MGNLAHVTPILQFQWALVKPLLPTLGA
jgi:hypothetical protein